MSELTARKWLARFRAGGELQCARSTIAAWLKRRGPGRLKNLDEPAPLRRYQP